MIHTNSKNYPIYIGEVTDVLSVTISQFQPSSVFIFSDETVARLHLDTLRKSLPTENVYHHIVPSGEGSKSFDMYYQCQTAALEAGLDRHSLIIAFGGGMIGDLAGFVAATYMRGIRFIQVPTTLLAHDSAVGGKVAINHPLGKNMIGAFYQPEAVIYHLPFLQTLSEKEWRSGLGEVIKHGYISGELFLRWLEENVHTFEDLHDNTLLHMIKEGIAVKANIVAQDEKETGVRAYLNFGHTLGHAIEAEVGYGKMTHGDAVAIGMVFAIQVSEYMYQKSLNIERLTALLGRFDYPTIADVPVRKLIDRMRQDKKSYDGDIHMVLMKNVGEMELVKIPEDVIESQLKHFVKGWEK